MKAVSECVMYWIGNWRQRRIYCMAANGRILEPSPHFSMNSICPISIIFPYGFI